MRKDEARTALAACGLSKDDPMIIAATPRLVTSAVAAICAAYAVLLLVRAVVCA